MIGHTVQLNRNTHRKETERKERVGRPWCCIVNFKTDTVELHGGGGIVFCKSVLFPLHGIA